VTCPIFALSGAGETQFQVHLESVGLNRAIRESSLLSMASHDGDARDFGEPNGEPTTTVEGLRQAIPSRCGNSQTPRQATLGIVGSHLESAS